MNRNRTYKIENKLAVFLTLFYAVATRSILGNTIFRNPILALYYATTYCMLIVCFLRSFDRGNGHQLFAPKGMYICFMAFLIVLFGLFKAQNTRSLLYYGMAFLIPFALTADIKKHIKGIKVVGVVMIALVVGCVINLLFPSFYINYIAKMFSGYSYRSVTWLASMGEFFPGFMSQSNYTSFFIGIGIGAVFCFREHIYKKTFLIVLLLGFFGILLTGKRGAMLYAVFAVLGIYLLEGNAREKAGRAIKIIAIIILSYFLLYIVARITNVGSINRIFNSIHMFVTGEGVDSTGREQLQEAALDYFRKNWLFGIGWGNFHILFRARKTHVHNIYLQLLCEGGIIGFSVFVILFVSSLKQCLKKINQTSHSEVEYSWLLFSLYIQIFFLMFGITENPLYDVEEIIIYFFAIGVTFLPKIKSEGDDLEPDLYG